jgi:hypothetical protein
MLCGEVSVECPVAGCAERVMDERYSRGERWTTIHGPAEQPRQRA